MLESLFEIHTYSVDILVFTLLADVGSPIFALISRGCNPWEIAPAIFS